MKRKLLFFVIICMFLFSSCMKHNFDYGYDEQRQIKENVLSVLGMNYYEHQDWCTSMNGQLTIHANTSIEKFVKAQILVSTINKEDTTVNMLVLNEAKFDNNIVTMTYDIPKLYDNLFIAFITDQGRYYYKEFKFDDTDVYFDDNNKSKTRGLSYDYVLPKCDLVIWSSVESFANQRGWLPGEMLYSPYVIEYMNTNDYNSTFKTLFNTVLFSYFKNGRKYNNLHLIKKSGYYNESYYPITTGDDPIIVSPVYKNDGGYHEISQADLYYYYFDGNKDLTVAEIEALPKYKAIDLSTVYANNYNNKVAKEKSYALVYWGDSQPEFRTTLGSFKFPKGYKIGFMYHSKTTYEAPKKQGEVYGDGRLNYNINKWGNFKSSGLGDTEPRMAWANINDKLFLCVESGTDADFNDLILEVEGGIEPIIIPPLYEYNSYIFLFEDHMLGDYDMNDIVLKGERIDETNVKYTLMACGAYDDIYIYNVEGEHIKSNKEAHDILGRPHVSYVNTIEGDNCDYVVDVINVDKNFSFLDVTTQPYIYDATENWTVKVARRGEDPHAIMIPYDMKWPLEQICIKDAYFKFNSWGVNDLIEDGDWYEYPYNDKVFTK